MVLSLDVREEALSYHPAPMGCYPQVNRQQRSEVLKWASGEKPQDSQGKMKPEIYQQERKLYMN